MRLIRFEATGLYLFPKGLNLDFYAKRRVSQADKDTLFEVSERIYTNNTISIVGMNASGKTSILKVISLVLQMSQGVAINQIGCKEILGEIPVDIPVSIKSLFALNGEDLVQLTTEINILDGRYSITKEIIEKMPIKSLTGKNKLQDFVGKGNPVIRTGEEEYLLPDVSMIVGLLKKDKSVINFIDLLNWTNFNSVRYMENYSADLISFLDPNIKSLSVTAGTKGKNDNFQLKFKNTPEIQAYSLEHLEGYLSSGTIKGLNVFISAILTLQKGGYLIVDEVENHFHKEIVSTLLHFFMDKETNPLGAVIIFTTHYPELLDILDRQDSIYLTKNLEGICVENFSDLQIRPELKKSELFFSGSINGTAPSYKDYQKLRQGILANFNIEVVK